MATDKNRGLDLNGIESLEPMILMSASAADIDAATLDDATEGNDVMIALEAGGLMDGKAGHDILIGLAGDNYLKGGAGHDMLIAFVATMSSTVAMARILWFTGAEIELTIQSPTRDSESLKSTTAAPQTL
jgi:hypothetical protein